MTAQLVVFDRPPYPRRDRCVECGAAEITHLRGDQRPYCKGYKSMNLPKGKTCGDCIHIRRCNALFGHMATDEACDWFPIRFRERTAPDAY